MTPKEPLSVTHPELAKQAVGWDPTTVSRGSNKEMKWKCVEGHLWTTTVANRSSGRGCPFCSGRQVIVGLNDLATLEPELAKQAHGWDPKTVKLHSNRKLKWICERDHKWSTTVASRTSGAGCPFCSGRFVDLGVNDLATLEPELAEEAHGWDPTTVSLHSDKRREWKCCQGHLWTVAVKHRTSGSGCPLCSGREVTVSVNDLATLEPELANEAYGWNPSTLMRGSGVKKEWKCNLGHVWTATLNNRSSGIGCPYCNGNKVLRGFNDLATLDPGLANQADGWDPRTVARRAGLKKNWKCEFGHKWTALVSNRSAGNGCPTCAIGGFDPNSSGWLYFLKHPEWELLQIGITNFPQDRLKKHESRGWEIIEVRGPMDGLITRGWETSILQMLKRHGAKLALENVAGKFDGYTEAWLEESYKVQTLRELMDAVERDE